ncbi:MAG TPA: mechanosensitive ion channel domain-containing protein [Verrucomicrobiae bacterium]|nr:mechanosensitive ion channel domain-containing protein [Verrucomicrobiae bacterium]
MKDLIAGWKQILDFPLLKAGGTQFTVGHVLELVFLLALVFIGEVLMRRVFVTRFLERTRLRPSVRFAVRQVIRYTFLALGIYLSLQAVGVNLSSLAFLAGALGVGVGFGLQNIVSNFISGLIILAEQPIALGDRIDVGGVTGQVTEINLRSTTVVTNDNICIIVPNSSLITANVVNWSHGDPKVRTRLPVGVAYGTDVEKLRKLLLEVARVNPDILQEPPPEVLFVGYGDSSINFELAVWSITMLARPSRFRSELYYAMHRTLEEHHIEIPFPQRDLHLRSGALVLQNGAAVVRSLETAPGPVPAPPSRGVEESGSQAKKL